MIMRPLSLADVSCLAALHAACFGAEAWSADQLYGSLNLPTTRGIGLCAGEQMGAFSLAQVTDEETEILTICVDPARRRCGFGQRLLRESVAAQAKGTVFLDVAADNVPALRLYEKTGFMLFGRRPCYYDRPEGKVDALTYRYLVNEKP